MFKQLYALARQLVTLMQDVQKLKAEQKGAFMSSGTGPS
jgi:hypothetical protein